MRELYEGSHEQLETKTRRGRTYSAPQGHAAAFPLAQQQVALQSWCVACSHKTPRLMHSNVREQLWYTPLVYGLHSGCPASLTLWEEMAEQVCI